MCNFEIQVYKRNRKKHYRWDTHLIYQCPKNQLFITAHGSPRSLEHQSKGATFTFQTHAIECFWENLPFSLGLALDPINHHINIYCNLHEPIIVSEKRICFVDLDLDLVRNPNTPNLSIVDEDEFEIHRKSMNYPATYTQLIPEIAQELLKRMKTDFIFQDQFFRKLFTEVHQNTLPKAPSDAVIEDLIGHFQQEPWADHLYIPNELCVDALGAL
jgi:protein associated with RNAse G/E